MKTVIKILLLCSSIVFACEDSSDTQTTCSVGNPVEELDWLAAAIDDMEQSAMSNYLYVTKANYGPGTVFIFGNCCPNCSSIVPVYNCSGQQIGTIGDQISPDILKHDKLVWAPENTACQLGN